MNSREFFFAVANMRAAQRSYIETRDPASLRAAIMAEKEIDDEIARVKTIIVPK